MLLWVMDGCVQEFCYKKCYSRESNQLLGIVFLNHLAPFGKSRCIYLCFVPSIFFVGDQFSRKSGPFKEARERRDILLGNDNNPWEPTTFIFRFFRGYNPHVGGVKPSFFHGFEVQGVMILIAVLPREIIIYNFSC